MPSWPGPVGLFSCSTVPEVCLSDTPEVFKRIRAEEQKLWVPGRGDLTVGEERIKRVIQEYDERLVLARHEITGDWVVFITVDRDTLYPVIGLGPELPTDPEDVKRRLYETDAARHGTKILDQINRRNDDIRKARAQASDEAIGETA